MSKRKKLTFKTKAEARKNRQKKILIAFFTFLILFAAASFFILLRSVDYDLGNLFEGREETAASTDSGDPALPELSGNANFLAVCVSDEKKFPEEIIFVYVINADLNQKKFRVCSLSANTIAKAGDNALLPLKDHYKNGGIQHLKEAVENLGGIKINKYTLSPGTGFQNAIKAVEKTGGLKVYVEQTVNFKNERFSLLLPPGENTINAETLLRYLRYNALQGDRSLDTQAKLMCDMLEKYIDCANREDNEAVFEQLINSTKKTDIRSDDFHKHRRTLQDIAVSKSAFSFSVDQNLNTFITD